MPQIGLYLPGAFLCQLGLTVLNWRGLQSRLAGSVYIYYVNPLKPYLICMKYALGIATWVSGALSSGKAKAILLDHPGVRGGQSFYFFIFK